MSNLQHSFAAIYALLERPRAARRAVAVLLAIHTGLLAYSAYVHSPTLNEPGHLVAGLSHWKFGRFEIYCCNPPLVKMVAALPVIAAGYNEDWSGFYTGPGARPEFSMGEDFVAANGERSFFLFMIARWACIPFSWIGAITCYLWARDLYGRPAGVFACTIWCFEPNILAHASLMTPDAHATALGLAACYTFWRWLQNPTWTQAALTGIVLGLAELAKTTLILFYPLWPLMWIIYRLTTPHPSSLISDPSSTCQHPVSSIQHPASRFWLREAGMLALRMLIGLYILNLGYGFEGSFTQLKDFHFVSNLFTGKDSESLLPAPSSPLLAHLPAPFPKHYLLGIDITQRDQENENGVRLSYLRGEWRDHGWWYYYLYACAIKVPLGLWALGALTIFLRLTRSTLLAPRSSHADEAILLFPAFVIFVVVSSKTGFSEHTRYVLPAFPFFFIAISQTARLALSPLLHYCSAALVSPDTRNPTPDTLLEPPPENFQQNPLPPEFQSLTNDKWGVQWTQCVPRAFRGRPAAIRRSRPMALIPATLVASLGTWLVASSLWIYPHSLSYFNESIGGPLNGPKHLLGSNVDWGQDLLMVRDWMLAHPEAGSCRLAYHGGFNPSGVRIGCSWLISNSSNNEQRAPDRRHGEASIAISANLLNRYPIAFPCENDVKWTLNSEDFALIDHMKRVATAGYSMHFLIMEYSTSK
jgi:hypothetical protein